MENNPAFLVLDCTVRDGGYVNNWGFPHNMVQDMYRASSNAGVDVFEVGFLNDGENLPLWRCCPSEAVKAVRGGTGGAKISAMLEVDTVGMTLGSPLETGVDILRVALNRDKIVESLPKMAAYRTQGYQVFVQMMGITSYRDIDILKTIEVIEKSGYVDFVNVGDSYGSLMPSRTKQLITLMKSNTGLKVGIHLHNNMQLGIANVLAAYEAGADIIDGTMYGMGRGGGNVPLELILAYFGKMFPERFDVLPVLEYIDQHLLSLADSNNWGYSLPSLLSGVYECHPYYTSRLVDTREYTIAQVLKTVQIVSESDVIGFSDQLLTSIVESGFASKSDELEHRLQDYVDGYKGKAVYINRHKGRPFLILGNGPSLKQNQADIQAFIKKHDPVVLGANHLGGLFVPDYHAFNNQRRYDQYAETASSESTLLLGPAIDKDTVQSNYEKIICFNSSLTDLDIQDGVITSNCRSIAILLGAVALVMGATQLYFAGLDGYLGEGDTMFYKEEESNSLQNILKKHNDNQKYLNQLFECCKISGCGGVQPITPTTYTF